MNRQKISCNRKDKQIWEIEQYLLVVATISAMGFFVVKFKKKPTNYDMKLTCRKKEYCFLLLFVPFIYLFINFSFV